MARVVAGRYHLVRQLGRGGMGVVWHATDGLLDRDVAVKEIWLPGSGAGSMDPADPLAARALREARAAAQLRHPGIITVHDVVIDDGRPWIVMELIDGRSLGQVVGEDGVLDAQRTAAIGLRVLDALRAAHRLGILHRDVKPPNILLDGDRVVLTDFGIAAVDGGTALTATGQMVGSPAYLAPERINGRPAAPAADLWALGVTLYVALTGRSPFQRDTVQSTFAAVLTSDPDRPAEAGQLWPAIRGLLAKDPARRLTADRAAELLAKVAYPHQAPDQRTPTRRQRWWWTRPSAPPRPPATAPTRSADERALTGDTTAAFPRRRAIHRAGVVVLAAMIVAASLTWLRPAWLPGGPEGETPAGGSASPMVLRPEATSAASSTPASPAPSLPAAPPGFKVVPTFKTFVFAVPLTWAETNLTWASHDGRRAGPVLQASPYREAPRGNGAGAGISAQAFLDLAEDRIAKNEGYRRTRLTSVAAPRGASSAAEWEYTTVLPEYLSRGSERRFTYTLARAIVLTTGEIIMLDVSVNSDTQAALRRDWQQARSTLTQVSKSLLPLL